MRLDRRGLTSGSIAVLVPLVLVYVGSEGLRWFDAALAPYLLGTLLAVFAVVYRYVVSLRLGAGLENAAPRNTPGSGKS
jgi:hypothetical protein